MQNMNISCRKFVRALLFSTFIVVSGNMPIQAQPSLPQKQPLSASLCSWVDPKIGSGGHGHVFIGASVPFGLVQLGPTNVTTGWDWCSGYHDSDHSIIGFSHTHLNGTGCSDLGDIALMPAIGDVPLSRGTKEQLNSGLGSTFDKKTERVEPGFYAVHLDRFHIDAELTTTTRTGLHRYTFPKSDDARIIIDLKQSVSNETQIEVLLNRENNTTITGYRHSRGWANNQKLYFALEFSRPMKHWFTSAGQSPSTRDQQFHPYGVAVFDTCDQSTIMVKVGLSLVSIDNAKANLKTEQPGWDFDKIVSQAQQAWNTELSRISISTADDKIRKIFYTALYHTMIYPAVCSDIQGDYRGADGKIYRRSPHPQYTGYSLWDTYRALHPLMTLIHPEKVPAIVQSMLDIFDEQGKLPVWHLMGCETNCMVGNPGICVVADAIMKDFPGIPQEKAFQAMKQSAMLDERGLKFLKQYGYIPYDLEPEGLSKCMEYAIADWSIAQTARKLGKEQDYQYFLTRSQAWNHYFDPQTQFIRGRSSTGQFREPFNPFQAVHRMNDYTEGNAWQYTWLVPHDIDGLIKAFGGKKPFLDKLDRLFIVQGDLGKEASPDISGLIGQYAHGNEPSHHIAYMFSYAGRPDKTAEKVREILATMYDITPEGLCGNEDMGQMSAWYILSALGFYQVEPAGGKFVFGSPIIDKATLQVGAGKLLNIIVHNNGDTRPYIDRVKFNGKKVDTNYIHFKDMAAGGTLEFYMTSTPPQIPVE